MGVLEVKDVSIQYMTGDFKDIGIKEYVMRKLTKNYHVNEFWADRHINFALEKGDMLGIIGANGAGKSTLLKVVSGIMEPTEGSVHREGSLAALLELGSGFDGDLTVKENTYLRGAMLGYTREFMDEMYDSIISFAELEDFQEYPFKQLSSGMQSRLAFAIASLVNPDILILDEVLSVGDGAFRKKSEEKMREIIGGGATTILVTHSIDQVRQMCNKVLWLHKGEQVAFGDNVNEICDRYEEFLNEKIDLKLPAKNKESDLEAERTNLADDIEFEKDADTNKGLEVKMIDEESRMNEINKECSLVQLFKNEWAEFKTYLYKSRWWILLSSVLLLTTYSAWLLAPELHIDPDEYIMHQGSRWGGYTHGRQGMTLINILFIMENLNPNFATLFGWLAICVSCVVIGYVFYRAGLRSPGISSLFGLLMIISPSLAEQFYWYQRIFCIAVGYIFCALGAGISYYGILKRQFGLCLLSIFPIMFACSIYQIFAIVYVVFSVLFFVFLYRRLTIRCRYEDINYIAVVLKQIFIFVVAYSINALLTKLFFFSDDAGLVDMTVFWGTMPLSQNIHAIIGYVVKGLFGGRYYLTGFYSVIMVCAIIAVIAECVQSTVKRGKALYIIAVLALQTSPFLLAVYCGGEPIRHTQFMYSTVLAGNIVILADVVIRNKKVLTLSRLLVFVLAVGLFWTQSQTVMRMLYTDQVRIEEDKRVIANIAANLDEKDKPVIFIGGFPTTLNPACIRGEYIGISALGWDRGAIPHYVAGSNRTCQIINTIGLNLYGITDAETAINARKEAISMPAWPAQGYIKETESCYIIKLSEDEWPEEIIVPELQETKLSVSSATSAINAFVDYLEIDDGNLMIKGYIDQENDRKQSWAPHVYLQEYTTGRQYELSSMKFCRQGLWLNGEICVNCGFMAAAPIAELPSDLSEYALVFGYEDKDLGEEYIIMPQVTVETTLGGPEAGLPEDGIKEKTDLPAYRGFRYSGFSLDDNGGIISTADTAATLYGPYSPSVEGVYDITLNYEVMSYSDSDTGTFDVALDAEQVMAIQFSSVEKSVTLRNVVIEGGHAFEVRVMTPAGMVMKVQSIRYERVQ